MTPTDRPPIRWWVPAAGSAALSAALVSVVLRLVPTPGPLDDPDPAEQRDGIVRDGPALAQAVGDVRFDGRTTVLLFERTAPSGPGYQRWSDEISQDGVRLVVCVAGSPRSTALARAVGLAVPTDGGAPVGYAVVDQDRRVRYETLDPVYQQNAFEVNVITRAIRR